MTTPPSAVRPSLVHRLGAWWALRRLDHVGRALRVVGRPYIQNAGTIRVGDRVVLDAVSTPVHLVTYAGAVLEIGDDVHIGPGTSLAAFGRVRVGDGVRIGANCLIVDDDRGAGVVVEDGAWIDDDVQLFAGAVVRAGARIARGSVITGPVLPADENGDMAGSPGVTHAPASLRTAAGVPANDAAIQARVREVVAALLPAAGAANLDADLRLVGGWESLTALHLLIQLEELFGVSISAEQFAHARSLRDLSALVTAGSAPAAKALAEVVAPVRPRTTPSGVPALGSAGRVVRGVAGELRALTTPLTPWRVCLALANALPDNFAAGLRTALLRQAGCRVARGTLFLGRIHVSGAGAPLTRLLVGTGCLVAPGVTFGLDAEIRLGTNVSISPNATLHTASHDVQDRRRRMDFAVRPRPILVENGVWIGLGAMILPGVRIGAGSVVSAGAVVEADVLPDRLIAGNPATVRQVLPGALDPARGSR